MRRCVRRSLSLSLSLSGVSDAPKRALVQAKSSSIWCETLRFKKDEKSASQKKKKVEREKGKTRYMEKVLRSVFPLSFLTETQQRLAGEKKKDVVRPPICVVCSVSFLPSAVHVMSAKRQRKRAKKNHTARSVLRRKPPLGFLLRSPTTWRKKKKRPRHTDFSVSFMVERAYSQAR